MDDWFNKRTLKTFVSFVSYTSFVVVATWASFRYIYVQREVDFFEAKAQALEVQVAQLREENKKYLEWLSGTPKTIPYLEQKINSLNDELHPKKITVQGKITTEDAILSGTVSVEIPPYSNIKTLNINEAWVDPKTKVVFSIGRIMPDFSVSAVLGLPGEKTQKLEQVKDGDNWIFVKDAKRYQLTVWNVNWYSNKVEVRLVEILDATKK